MTNGIINLEIHKRKKINCDLQVALDNLKQAVLDDVSKYPQKYLDMIERKDNLIAALSKEIDVLIKGRIT